MTKRHTPESAAQFSDDSAALYVMCSSPTSSIQIDGYRALWTYLYRVALHMTRQQPDGDALAQDCAQRALVKIHHQLQTCRDPNAFRAWSRRIVTNLVIDELRKRKRLQPLDQAGVASTGRQPRQNTADTAPEERVLGKVTADRLRHLLNQAPISERSRRVVIGRYLDDVDDEQLAKTESELVQQDIRPSHVQVTRSKNIGKLRDWELLHDFLREATS